MKIVGAYACSHAGLIVTRKDQASSEVRDDVFGAYATVRDEIERSRPDAVVILATDHMRAYPLSNVPGFAIGVGPVALGVGDGGLDPCKVPVHQPLAQWILTKGVERGVDFVFSEDVSIDHSFVMPLSLLTPELDVPIVPITQNCNVPPRPTFDRSHEVGRVIGEAIRSGPDGRVVVISTGGLSHWVGDAARRAFMNRPAGTRLPDLADHPVVLEDTGPINAGFDRDFLRKLETGAARAFIREWPAERVEEEAGNGAQEIRNWLTGAAIVDDAPAEVLSYQPVAEWLTGTAVARFRTS